MRTPTDLDFESDQFNQDDYRFMQKLAYQLTTDEWTPIAQNHVQKEFEGITDTMIIDTINATIEYRRDYHDFELIDNVQTFQIKEQRDLFDFNRKLDEEYIKRVEDQRKSKGDRK